MITTNYPVIVTVEIRFANQTLLNSLISMRYVEMDIAGTYQSPPIYDNMGIAIGTIPLQYDKNTGSFIGTNTLIFKHSGANYMYTILVWDWANSLPITGHTSSNEMLPPPLSIDETYSARTNYVQSSQNTALSITVIGITLLTFLFALIFELNARDSEELKRISKEILNVNETINGINRKLKLSKKDDQNKRH